MVQYLPGAWPQMRQAIYDWADGQVACPVIWKRQSRDVGGPIITALPGAPAPRKPYVAIGLVTPPVQIGCAARTTNGVSVQVVAAGLAPSTTYAVTVDGDVFPYTTPASPAPTVASVRDGLYQALSSLEGHDVGRYTPDSLTIVTPQGQLAPVVSVSAGLALKAAVLVLADATCVFQVDAYADASAQSPDPAMVLAQVLAKSLEKPSVEELLDNAGWGFIDVIGWRKPDLVVGSAWEDRAGFDLKLACRTAAVDLIDYLEDPGTIAGTLTA